MTNENGVGPQCNGSSNVERPTSTRHFRRQSSITYSAQKDLPRLPIPTLEETLEKFPQVVSALQDARERKNTERVIEESKEELQKLQTLLEEYEQEGRETGRIGSYVEEFWNDSYLAPDQSVVLNLNPFFVLEDGPDAKIAKDQIQRAASLTLASVKLASLLKHESLKPDVFRGTTLCMDQFKALFGSCRLPLKGNKDCVAVFPESTHVAVMSRGQMYYFNALWPDGTVAVNENDIMEILEAIKKNSEEMEPKECCINALGVLTSLPRKEWAAARDNMVAASEQNSESLQMVDSALFVLVLDHYVPVDVHDAAANMLHGTYKLETSGDLQDYQIGTCCNRWYDKLQIIVCRDGTTGVNFEHSAIDGHTALRFVSDVFAETVVKFAQSITKLIYGKGRVPHVIQADLKRATQDLDESGKPKLDVFPKKLVFELPASVLDRIHFAETALGDQIVSSDTVVLEFKTYGKLLITSNSMSPDSFVQMSMLLAYYRLYGKIVCAYEPVLTKQFYHGRTEAMRTATPQASEFCQVWTSRFTTNEEKMEALRKAIKEHSRLVKESASGKGVDRHLFALKCIAERNNLSVPQFFKSDPWRKLNHTVLSTSNCGNPALRLFGFGPVVQDGFGIGYIIKDNGLQYAVSSKHRQTKRFVHTLEQTLLQMQDLMTPIPSVVVKKHASVHEMFLPEKQVHQSPSLNDVTGHSDAYGSIYGETEEDDQEIAKQSLGYFSRVIPHTSVPKSNIGMTLALDSFNDEK